MIRKISALIIAILAFALCAGTQAQAQNAKPLASHPLGLQQGITVSEWTYQSGKLKVKGRLYCPSGANLPIVIFNHDGNNGITRSHHLSSLRLAKQGYIVFCPSYRGEDGSDGIVEIAKGEVTDVLNAVPLLQALPQANGDRIVIMGASHGALISLLAAGRRPELFSGLIFAYGVSDIYSWWDYLRSHNKLGKDALTRRTYGDGPSTNPESFAIRYGLGAVPNLQCPVLILQGKLDDITPPEQAKELYEECQNNGIKAKLCLYPNALHGFLVYAPYLTHDVTEAEKQEAGRAWYEVFNFCRTVTK